jgi:hypothetical protein
LKTRRLFPGKDALLFALAQDGFRGLQQIKVRNRRGERPIWERLNLMIGKVHLRYSIARAPITIMFPAQDCPDPSRRSLGPRHFQQLSMAFTAVRTDCLAQAR